MRKAEVGQTEAVGISAQGPVHDLGLARGTKAGINIIIITITREFPGGLDWGAPPYTQLGLQLLHATLSGD